MLSKYFTSSICVYLIAIVLGGVVAQGKNDARLVRGQKVTIDKAPFTVQLRNRYNMFGCGGSLVTAKHVVTAAHCVENQLPEYITVVGGATRSDEEGVRQTVESIHIHPNFTSESGDADVAVLKMSGELKGTNISTIPLCTKEPETYEFMHVFGWGWTEKEARVSEELEVIEIPVLSQELCQKQYKDYRMKITDNMMCAALPGVMDSCTGDSGGPAVFNKELCGIVSWGNGCGNPDWPGVYTRVVKVSDFIKKHIGS